MIQRQGANGDTVVVCQVSRGADGQVLLVAVAIDIHRGGLYRQIVAIDVRVLAKARDDAASDFGIFGDIYRAIIGGHGRIVDRFNIDGDAADRG